MKFINLIILLLTFSGCELSETGLEVCDGDQCQATEVGPNNPVYDDIQRIPGTSGSIRIMNYQKSQFPENREVLDIRTHNGKVWIYLENKVSNSIKNYELYESDKSMHLHFRRCQWLDDNLFSGAMIFNNNEILIPEKNSQFTLRNFDLCSCNEQSTVSTGESLPYSSRHKLAGIRNNELFYQKGSKLAALNLSTRLNSSEDDELVLGSKTGLFSSLRAMTIQENVLWLILRNDLWRVNLNAQKMAWVDLSRQISGYYKLTLNVTPEGDLLLSQWNSDHSLESWVIDVRNFN